MIKLLSLNLILSLLAHTLADDSISRSGHHLPDTAPDMDLKPAFQRNTESPHLHRSHHSHDFSLPMPRSGFWNGEVPSEPNTEPYEYEYETTEVLETYDWNGASGDFETTHERSSTTYYDDGMEGRESLTDQLSSDAPENKLMSLLILIAVALLLVT